MFENLDRVVVLARVTLGTLLGVVFAALPGVTGQCGYARRAKPDPDRPCVCGLRRSRRAHSETRRPNCAPVRLRVPVRGSDRRPAARCGGVLSRAGAARVAARDRMRDLQERAVRDRRVEESRMKGI